MAPTVEAAWKLAQQAEKDLLTALTLKDPTFADIDYLVAQYRSRSETLLFQNFEFAASKLAEGHLWDAHLKINSRYRKQLAKFAEEHGTKKPVEKRKLQKHYIDFIKSSTRFYRGYVQRLASHFGGIPEVANIAKKFNLGTLSAAAPVSVSTDVRHLILLSCHATLVRLGDLSRYRETELKTVDRNWGPAIGYYDLAGALLPSSGASFNQLAVIAVTDGNHLKALYHLYRALSAEDPHPAAKGNLEIEFKKILSAWSKGQLIQPQDQKKPGKALEAWFTCLHARCYKGLEYSEHDELENEVLSQLSVDLKERALSSTLQKFSIINIAAEYLASMRAQAEPNNPENLRSFVFFQRFNVKTFFTLLQILLPELEQFASDEPELGDSEEPKNSSERVTAIARRVLPTLRQYSSWLQSSAHILVAQESDPFIGVQIKEFWKIYANALTLLAATFPVAELPVVDYLLEEDADTLGFKPLINDNTTRRYTSSTEDGYRLKPGSTVEVEQHHPNIEMLFRIREILTEGLILAMQKHDPAEASIPIILVDGNRFEYQEEGLASGLLSSPPTVMRQYSHGHSHSSASIGREDIERVKRNGVGGPLATSVDDETSQSASMSISANTAMNRMVDDIVGFEASGKPLIQAPFLQIQNDESPPTPLGRCFEDEDEADAAAGAVKAFDNFGTATALNLIGRMQTTPVGTVTAQSMEHQEPARLPFPSIWNTPPAPLLGETSPSLQTRPSTARYSPPRTFQPINPQQTPLNQQSPPLRAAVFHEELRRKQETHPSPFSTDPQLSSWAYQTPDKQENWMPSAYQRELWMRLVDPDPSPSCSPYGLEISSSDSPHASRQMARFGATGHTPPSGQGG